MLTLSMGEKKVALTFDITIERRTRKRLSEEKLKDQLEFIAQSAKRNASFNLSTSVPSKLMTVNEYGFGENRELQYTAVITVSKERYTDEAAVRRRFAKTRVVMERAAKKKGWAIIADEKLIPGTNGTYQTTNGAGEPIGDPAPRLISVLAEQQKALKEEKKKKSISPFLTGEKELPSLTDEAVERHFSRIYDRESHIRVVYDNLKTAIRTRFKTRHHILLKGPPACAKTELFLSFVDWIGSDLIEEIDASTMTKAGLERLLLEKAESGTLKPILLMEEIEKCHPDNINCLIQVMDARGRIQRVNAHTVRDGGGVADCKIVVWATCNDEKELEKAHKGAIWSRFSNKLDCERPDRDLMKRILYREVDEIDGKEEWIDPVLSFCFDELSSLPKFKRDYDDPRFARALLAGGDRILDGSSTGFLADIRKTRNIGKRK